MPTRTVLLGVLSLVLLPACGGGGGAGSPPGPAAASTCPPPLDRPLAAPTFSGQVLPALQAGCGSDAVRCHGGVGIPDGHVSYFTGPGRTAAQVYGELVGVTPSSAPAGWARVKPGDPDRSWLLEKLTSDCPGSATGGCYGARMPAGNPPLCGQALDNLRTWIRNGAPL